jgi:2-oxoisovalerate dehydrogenase E1 component
VPRITSHSSQDDDAYRSPAERAEAEAHDPLPRLRETLLEHGLLEHGEEEELLRVFRARALAEADRALTLPEPEASRARRWLFAGDPPHPELAALEAGGIGTGPFDGIDLTPQPPHRRGEGEQDGGGIPNGVHGGWRP